MADQSNPRFTEIVPPNAKIVALPWGYDIGGGDTAGWGRGCDGPLWLQELNCFSFTDIAHNRRLGWTGDKGYFELENATNGGTGTTRDNEGRLITCEWETSRITRLERDGSKTLLADKCQGQLLNRPDDVVVGADGSIYFTDLRTAFPPLEGDVIPHSGLYRISPDLATVECLVDDCATPGGLTLSPDRKALFMSDTVGGQIRRDAIARNGQLDGTGRTFIKIRAERGQPHGLTTDKAGNIYCGGPGGIWVMDPSGTQLGTIPLDASRISNLSFGGQDGKTLFITTAVGVGYIELNAQGTLPAAADAPYLNNVLHNKPLIFEQAIERHHADLDKIIAPGTEIQNLGSGGLFEDLGGGVNEMYARSLEGTLWVEDGQYFAFSDIGNSRRMKWTPAEGFSVLHTPTNHTNGATLDQQGRFISCEHSGRRVSCREADGTYSIVADRYNGKRLNRPNDVVVRSDGATFFTDPWWDFGAGEQPEIGFPGVYHVSPDRKSVTLIDKDWIVCNGLAFSPDEKILYVNDSYTFEIVAFDVRTDGSINSASRRVFCNLSGDRHGKPDGMKVDIHGNVYCGGAGGIWIISPTGEHLGTIHHGATQSNNLAFGRPDWRSLFFVSWTSVHMVQLLVPGCPVPSRKL